MIGPQNQAHMVAILEWLSGQGGHHHLVVVMLPNPLDTPLAERDRRRPIGWDWLLCWLYPIGVITYHHRRAHFTMTHVFAIVVACFLMNVVSIVLSLSFFADFLKDIVKTVRLDSEGVAAVFSKLTPEQRTAMLQQFLNGTPRLTALNSMTRLIRVFAYAMMGFAVYVVFKARTTTEAARRELLEGYLVAGSTAVPSPSMHPLLSSPKGTGPAFMAYTIALMFPALSYALNSDRRLVYYGIALLSTLFQLSFIFLTFAAAILPSLEDISTQSSEVLSVVATRLAIGAAASGLLYVVLPIRMALMNVYRARQRYAKTLTLE